VTGLGCLAGSGTDWAEGMGANAVGSGADAAGSGVEGVCLFSNR